jgi:chromosome segregation ATPase
MDPYLGFLIETFPTIIIDEDTVMNDQTTTTQDEETKNMLDKVTNAFEIACKAIKGESSMRKELMDLKLQVAALNTKVKDMEFTIQGWQERGKQSDELLNIVRRERNEAREKNNQLEAELNRTKQELVHHQVAAEAAMHKLGEAEVAISTLEKQVAKQEVDYLALLSERDNIKAKLDKVSAALGFDDFEKDKEEMPSPLTPSAEPTTKTEAAPPTDSGTPLSESEKPAGELKSEEATQVAEGEWWPSSRQPRDPASQRFTSYPKKDELN